MALVGSDIIPYYSIDGSGAQGDPNASLGGNVATNPVYNVESALTSSQSGGGRELIDTSQIGAGVDAHVGKYLVMMEGAAAVHAARVDEFDNATGRMVLREATPTAAAAGDTYRLHAVNELWSDVDGEDSSLGATHHRCIYLRNSTGGGLADRRVFIRLLSRGGVSLGVAEFNRETTKLVTAIANEDVAPNLAELNGSGSGAGSTPGFELPIYGTLVEVPPTNVRGHNDGADIPIWLQRVITGPRLPREEVAYQLIHVYSNTGGDPDPMVTSMVLAFDINGFTPDLTFSPDRSARRNGGVRFTLQVRSLESGEPVEGVDVDYELISGPGTLEPRDLEERRTNSRGRSFVSYTGPDSAGASATVRATI